MENSIKLSVIINELELEVLNEASEDRDVMTTEVARPGLPLAGFTELYQPHRFQIIGREEHSFLNMLDDSVRDYNIDVFMKADPVCVIFSSSLEPQPEFFTYAKKYGVPLEINLLGLNSMRHYPNAVFWSLASDMGCDVVIGSDAHESVGMYPERALRYAEKIIESNRGLRLLDTVEFKSIR